MRALDGRIALVTGASRGIGAAAADALAEAGARVARVARSLGREGAADRLDLSADLTDPAQVEALASRLSGTWGPPDLVVSCAGAFHLAPFAETTVEAFDLQIATNLRAPFLLARAFLPLMRQRGGRMITVGSVADHRAMPGNAGYGAAKQGLRGLHEVMREECRGTGVLCTLLSPGPTDTPAWDAIDPDSRPGFTPRRNMLRARDVADAILWVATRPPHVDVEWLILGPA